MRPEVEPASSSRDTLLRGHAHHVRSQFLRYFLVATVSFFVDLSLLLILERLTPLGVHASGAIAYAIGLTLNYILVTRWVFPHRRLGHRRWLEFLVYALISLSGMGVNALVLWGLNVEAGVHLVFAKAASGLTLLGWTFTLRKTLLFRARRQLVAEQEPLPSSP